MNTEFFIAKHIFSRKSGSFSRPIVRIAIISVALGLTVMIISVAIVTGFQREIREKVAGFGAHIRINYFDSNTSIESTPVSIDQPFYPSIESESMIRHIQVYAHKGGIIKTGDQIEGVVFKGIGSDFDWSFFQDKIIRGNRFSVSDTAKTNNILISGIIANKLGFAPGDDVRMYFIVDGESQPRGRKFEIAGIFETGLAEFDERMIIGDIGHIRKLNNWDESQVGGFEILLRDFDQIEKAADMLYGKVSYDLNVVTIKELFPQIFEWLDLHDVNVIIIITLMVMVSGITMISTFLILILEKTNMIGILKSLGTKNRSIRKIFLYNAAYIIGIGLFWGNAIGIGLALLQQQTGMITLNQESYYVSEVPVDIDFLHLLLLNAGTLTACLLMLIIPSYIVTRISPVKAIRFS